MKRLFMMTRLLRKNITSQPTEFIDVRQLMGDPSDNIPGVKGVGEKTAMSHYRKHHSIEYIYENIDDIGLKVLCSKR